MEETIKLLNDFTDKKIIDSNNMDKIFKAIDLIIVYTEELKFDNECLKKELEDVKQVMITF